jgi:hypothetical protein
MDDFLAEVEPGLSAEARRARAATLDPKLISPAYEAELKKNVVRLATELVSPHSCVGFCGRSCCPMCLSEPFSIACGAFLDVFKIHYAGVGVLGEEFLHRQDGEDDADPGAVSEARAVQSDGGP